MRTGIDKASAARAENTAASIRQGRDSVADALTYLTSVKVNNFYARVINLMDRIAVPGFGTMGVSVQNGKYIFIYDPLFAAGVSFKEVCATCEHEVLHLILEHIPRYMQMRRLTALDEDRDLLNITNNLAVDLAANELLAEVWPDIKCDKKPLGTWVIPEQFKPDLPLMLAYEEYQQLLLTLFRQRLKSPPCELYELAKQILQGARDALQKALGPGGPDHGDNQEGQGPGQGAGQGESEGQGQGQGQGEPGQGGGGGAGESDAAQKAKDLADKLNQLDPLDQKVVEMLVKSAAQHMAWDAASDSAEEGDSYKAQEHGKQLIKQSVTQNDKSRGTLPGHIRELIKRMLTPPTVPWTEFLHDIVQRTRQTKKTRGMSRPSKKISALKIYAEKKAEEGDPRFQHVAHIRRMPVFPGIKHENKFTIAYLVDTSGSMSRKDLQLGLNELQHIQKSDSDVRICVIYIDTRISKEYWIGPSDELDEEMTGRGGTDFEPGFLHVADMCRSQDNAPDILVYCTDGYAPAPQTKLPMPVVWLLTPHGRPIMNEAGHINIFMKDYQLEDPDMG